VFGQYINKYCDPTGIWPGGDVTSWRWLYTGDLGQPMPVPMLDQLRGKILLAFTDALELSVHAELDLSGFPYNAFGTNTNTTTLPSDGGSVTFHVQNIYDDMYKGDQASAQVTAIQRNIQNAAANTDPHNWYFTSTNRAGGVWTSRTFALGKLTNPPYPANGYNQVALDQMINHVQIATSGQQQHTVGVVYSTSPTTLPVTSKRFTSAIPVLRDLARALWRGAMQRHAERHRAAELFGTDNLEAVSLAAGSCGLPRFTLSPGMGGFYITPELRHCCVGPR
jgi:hypothetical protein